jgi:hypothetical protein
MGARLYDPSTGRFWSRDPIPGGNATEYDYCSADPVNCTDLDGMKSKKRAKTKKAVARALYQAASAARPPMWKSSFKGSGSTPLELNFDPNGIWAVVRAAKNQPYTDMALSHARNIGATCDLRAGLMHVCSNAPQGSVGRGPNSGVTIGNVFITSLPEVDAPLLRHETKHADQWAIFGASYPQLYFTAEGISHILLDPGQSEGCKNVFEMQAGLVDGNYRC